MEELVHLQPGIVARHLSGPGSVLPRELVLTRTFVSYTAPLSSDLDIAEGRVEREAKEWIRFHRRMKRE